MMVLISSVGNEKIAIDVKKKGIKYVLTVTGSSQPETVNVSFQADMFIFNGVPVGAAVCSIFCEIY